MKQAVVFFAFFFYCSYANAQIITPENRIVVIGSATLEVPADLVTFKVTIQTSDSLSTSKVYEEHKLLEKKLMQILKEEKIQSKHISYSLLELNRYENYETRKWIIYSKQEVSFQLDSLKQYTDLQTKLLSAGFYDIQSKFTSTQLTKFKKELLEEAIAVAKEKAEIMAKATNRKISRVVKVSDADEIDPTFGVYNIEESKPQPPPLDLAMEESLIEISQTIEITTSIKVVFKLK